MPLSKELPLRTKEQHTQAHRHPLIKKILRPSQEDIPIYLNYLVQLLAVYTSLENKITEERTDNIIAPFFTLDFFENLFRVDSIKKDIEKLKTMVSEYNYTTSAKTQIFVDNINNSSPAQLVGHIYTRYMGDLSGGQIIGRSLQRNIGDDCANFYRFDMPLTPEKAKSQLRLTIDDIPEIQHVHVIAGAQTSFALTVGIFDYLAKHDSPKNISQQFSKNNYNNYWKLAAIATLATVAICIAFKSENTNTKYSLSL